MAALSSRSRASEHRLLIDLNFGIIGYSKIREENVVAYFKRTDD